jgi:hypothetical protein
MTTGAMVTRTKTISITGLRAPGASSVRQIFVALETRGQKSGGAMPTTQFHTTLKKILPGRR